MCVRNNNKNGVIKTQRRFMYIGIQEQNKRKFERKTTDKVRGGMIQIVIIILFQKSFFFLNKKDVFMVFQKKLQTFL